MLAAEKDTGRIVWRAKDNTVDANIQGLPLEKTLRHLSAATGWQVYVQPDTGRIVRTKFKGMSPAEALKLLLGELNFALLPRADGPSKLLVYRTSLDEATQLVEMPEPERARKKGDPIPNELVVILKPGSKEDIEALAKRLGGEVLGKAAGVNAYRLGFPDEETAEAARRSLADVKSVANVDSNYSVDRPTRLDNLSLSSAPKFDLKPKGAGDPNQVIIGLIDTGVQPLTSEKNAFLLPSINVTGQPGVPASDISHGTSMAQTILHGLTVAPQETGGSSVRILPIDVYGPHPDTTTFDIAAGIVAAVNNGATIINMSMGGEGDSPFLHDIINEARRQGVLFFGAAGNEPSTAPVFPAAYPEVVAVTAGDKKGNIAPYANRGSFVDVIAPGVSLVQAGGQSYIVSGTSASTAYVSGTAAGFRALGHKPEEVEELIRESLSLKPKPPGK